VDTGDGCQATVPEEVNLRQRVAGQLSVAESAIGFGVGLGDPEDPRDAQMVQGRSVWGPETQVKCLVTTSPNWFGVTDCPSHSTARVVCLDAMEAVSQVLGMSAEEAADLWPHPTPTAALLRDVRKFAGALLQIRSVNLPWGRPIGAWFSVRTPLPATAWSAWEGPGLVTVPPSSLAAFLPGVIRCTPELGFSVSDYADSFAEFVRTWHPTGDGERLP
jgi:hypothetical protein